MPSLSARARLIRDLCQPIRTRNLALDLTDLDVYAAVPFNSYLKGDDPDASNLAIAKVAIERMEALGVPFIGQWEHTNLIRQYSDCMVLAEYPGSDGSGQWVRTDRLMKWIADTLREQFPEKEEIRVGLIGHLDHVQRVAALARYYGLTPKIDGASRRVPYDPTVRPGAQDWCRTPERFLRFEKRKARPALIAFALTGLI
ncbi:MAG TPA: hypothetical protein VEA36_03010 [Candidatus Paceibacterota bacterium]|nr:hypothetical protein [Candidatus Paceibacterota bacterium]